MRPRRADPGGWLVVAGLVVVALVCVGIPGAMVVWRVGRWISDGGLGAIAPEHRFPVREVVERTAIYVTIIAVLSVVVAWPAAWFLRSAGARARRVVGLVCVPLVLPSYLSYAGWGLLRGPGTKLGDWVANGPDWMSLVAIRVTAVAGLTFWSWPLAALVMWSWAKRIDQATLDGLELDGGTWADRCWLVLRLMAPGMVTAGGAVGLVMLGSVIPLDVAQVETYGVKLVRMINLQGDDVHAWWATWPAIAVAVVASVVMLRRTTMVEVEGSVSAPRGPRGWTARVLFAAVVLVWIASVVAPMELFLMTMRDPPHSATMASIWKFTRVFWHESGMAVVTSLQGAVVTAVVSSVIVVGSAFALSGKGLGWRWIGRTCILALCVAGLIPGVMVGSAIKGAWDQPWSMMENSWALTWIAHVARFGFLAALLGAWAATRETRDHRDLRALDGAQTLRGWLGAWAAPWWPTLVGAALAAGVLSFHEIESTVIVSMPGTRNLSQQLLDALHFSRDERLAAAAVNLVGAGIALAYGVGWLMTPGASRETIVACNGPRV